MTLSAMVRLNHASSMVSSSCQLSRRSGIWLFSSYHPHAMNRPSADTTRLGPLSRFDDPFSMAPLNTHGWWRTSCFSLPALMMIVCMALR